MRWPRFHAVDLHPPGLNEWAGEPRGQASEVYRVCIRRQLLICVGRGGAVKGQGHLSESWEPRDPLGP